MGQADGGTNAGTYFEIGVAPGYAVSKASIAVPVKVGLSLDDYYELDGTDKRFGFASVAAMVTVPTRRHDPKYGSWNMHGGVEFQTLGDTTACFNGDQKTRTIGSVGIGFAY